MYETLWLKINLKNICFNFAREVHETKYRLFTYFELNVNGCAAVDTPNIGYTAFMLINVFIPLKLCQV